MTWVTRGLIQRHVGEFVEPSDEELAEYVVTDLRDLRPQAPHKKHERRAA